MPDRWGRPTFQDGFNIYRGLQMIESDNAERQNRKTEQDAYAVADLLGKNGDVSEFTPEARQKGSRLYWDNKLSQLKIQTQESLKSEAGRRDKMAKLDLNLKIAQQRMKDYGLARSMEDDARAKEIAMQLSNENMYNGRFIEKTKGGYTATQWDGTKQSFQDLPIEEVDRLLGQYFGKSYDELMQWQLSAEQNRQMRNFETLQKAEAMYDKNGNPVGFKIPAGIWTPDGKPRGQHYVDLTGEREISKKAASKWRTGEQLGVKLKVEGSKKGGKDSRSTMQKDVEFISQVLNVSKKEALAQYRSDKTLPERLRLYNNEVDAIRKDYSLDDDKKAEKIQRLKEHFLENLPGTKGGLKDSMGQRGGITLPGNITKASEALKYLKEEHGMTEEQAREWLKSAMRPQ
jgi:hypothetical protein